mmetsp:Transcript_29792/g.53039  ORF Transcript_29792/g.53039 Transcript_29792/m.53039 type:complete len:82 (+) Transcript_29792:328-573(+)
MLLPQYGVLGVQELIRRHMNLAKAFEDLIMNDLDFHVPFTAQFGLVCFYLRDNDALTSKLDECLKAKSDATFLHQLKSKGV